MRPGEHATKFVSEEVEYDARWDRGLGLQD